MLNQRNKKKSKSSVSLNRAMSSVIEPLEDRVMLYGNLTTAQPLPYDLFFNANNGGVVDANGVGTGFTAVQPNKNTNAATNFFPEYNNGLIHFGQNLDGSLNGVLNLTTTGNATNGGPYEGDNSLVNGLETTFNASTGAWTINVRLVGQGTSNSLSYLANSADQGGIMFGQDDDNYIKLVAAAQPAPNTQVIQFIDEINSTTHTIPAASTYTTIGNFANINTLDLRMSGDPSTDSVIGFYRINGGAFVKLSQQFNYTPATASTFFSPTAHAGIIAMAKNNLAPIQVGFASFGIDPGASAAQSPSVTGITLSNNPADGKAYLDTSIIGSVIIPASGAGIDPTTLNSSSVQFTNLLTGTAVPAEFNTDGAGGVLIIHPTQTLLAGTTYQVKVTIGLLDTNGDSFNPFTTTFVTSTVLQNPVPTNIAFQDIALKNVDAHNYTEVKFGPDGDLYASTLEGLIYRWVVNPTDGSLGTPFITQIMQTSNGGLNVPREVTGFTFDPSSTSTSSTIVMWVSNSAYGSYGAADWTGKLSQLTFSGPTFTTVAYQDYVVGLPRSIKDHQVEQPSFGPDGALYVGMASNTAMGAPDNAWGNRPEDLLSASILRIDTGSIKTNRINKGLGALNVKTDPALGANAYSPYAAGAAVTLYATGVRNAFDILWVGNTLYAATNGSAANGNVPTTPAPGASYTGPLGTTLTYTGSQATGFTNPVIEPDMLYKIVQGGYYGHPDPARGQYILDGGNPGPNFTLPSGNTNVVIPGYPLGTKPDPNYQGTIDVLGNDNSADGMIVYKGTAFSGAINNTIVVAQYSAPQDLSILTLAANGNSVIKTYTGVAGLENLNSPLSVTQYMNGTNPTSPLGGNMYVSEYGADTIVMLAPVAPGAKIAVDKTTEYFNAPRGTTSPGQTITITNTGTSTLTFGAGALSFGGTNAGSFKVAPTPTNLAPQQSETLTVTFAPSSTSTLTAIQTATLTVATNDTVNPDVVINLRGLATKGTGGANEPSGQYILNLLQIGNGTTNITGTPDPTLNAMPYPPLAASDTEVQVKQFVKAGAGAVTLQTMALFTVTNGIRLGYYNSGDPTSKTQLLELNPSVVGSVPATQTVNPNMVGSGSFDPGNSPFSMYAEFPGFLNADGGTTRDSYQEDQLNTWDSNTNQQQKMRVYPLRDSGGNVVANSYVLIPEDFTTADDNDAVVIIRNVMPAPAGAAMGFFDNDGNTNSDVLTFARQQNSQLPWNTPTHPDLANLNPRTPQTPHSSIPLEIFNSGTTPLIINNIAQNSPNVGPFVSGASGPRSQAYTVTDESTGLAVTLPYSVPVGGKLILNVTFVAQGYLSGTTTGTFTNTIRGEVDGTLLVTTNDTNHPSKTFNLKGFWQIYPETTDHVTQNPDGTWNTGQYDEFPINQTLAGMGYAINTGSLAQLVAAAGANTAIGDEILSPYWNLADSGSAVGIRQLQSYHTAGNTATIGWFQGATGGPHNILTSPGSDAETVYPKVNATVASAGWNFTPTNTTPFGFEVDGWYSDNTRNSILTSSVPTAPDVGHYVRFYPAINENGVKIPNTYIMIMDYEGENFDYNDNAYLISNIRPATGLAAPMDVAGTTDTTLGNTITWNAVSTLTGTGQATLTGYNVYRSLSQSSGFGPALNTSPLTTTSFTDSTAAVGTRYFYRVTAIGNGAIAESNPTELTLTRPGANVIPASPSAFAAPTAPNTITLTWSLSSGATSYSILRSTTGPSGTYSALTQVGAGVSSFADTGLTTGASYSYEVVATNSTGSSAPSAAVTATAIVAPATPTLNSLIATSSTSITLNWTAVPTATDYTIFRSDGNNTNYIAVNNAPGQATATFLDNTLSPGVTYYYEIVANNQVGSSLASNSLNASTQQVIPVAPIADSAVANGATQITINWESVSNATSYFVQRSPDGSTGWTTITPVGGVTTLTFQDSGLAASTPYYYQVFATNAIGNSATGSNIVNTTTAIAAPVAPAQPTFGTITGTSIQINWAAVATAATYTLYRSPDGSTGWTPIFTTPDNATFTFTDQNLTPNTSYSYEIVATNAGGNSLASAVATTSTPQVQAATPGTLTATPVALSASVALSWGASSNATGYTVQRSAPDTGSGFSWSTIGTTTGGASTTYTDSTNVAFGTTYAYQIIATNSVAPSAASNVSVATTVPTIPSPLGGSVASFVAINLNWSDVAGETGFSIERAPAGTSTFAVVGTVGQGTLTFQDSNLTPATSYIYRVRAVDAGGFSDYTPTFSATTMGTSLFQDVGGGAFTDSLGNHWVADNPAAWTNSTVSNGAVAIANTTDDFLYYTRRFASATTMTYTAPADNGNYTLKLYFAETSMTAAGQRVFNVAAQGTQILSNFDIFKVAGAKTANIQTFNITISAGQLNLVFTSIVNNSMISAIQLIPVQPGQPATPTGLTAAAVDSKNIALSWTNNATNDTAYKVERSTDQNTWTLVNGNVPGSTVAGATLNFTDTGLKANTHYFYRVRATNGGLDSLNSNINSATTIVAAPTGVTAVGDGPTGIDVNWTAITGATGYTVQRSNDGSTGWSTVGTPTTNTFTDSGLTTGQTYFYHVSATVPAGTTSYSVNASSATGNPANAPTTPTNENAVANTATQITVTWSGVTGATSYQIFRNTDGSTNFGSAIGTVPDTGLTSYSFNDNNASPNTQYFYEVLAVNSGGPSPAPATLPTATTLALPAAPAGLATGNVTTSEIDLSWNAVAGAISYTLQQSLTGAAGTWTSFSPITPSGNATETFADTTVSPSKQYFYQISVTTPIGTSLFSTPAVTATTLTVAPGAPTGLAIANVASTEIDLTWNAVSGATNYSVQQSLTGLANSWTTIHTVALSGNATESYADQSPSPLTQYFYQIIANNSGGPSAASASVNAITAPATPTGLNVTNTTSGEIDLSWTAIAGVTNYVLQRSLTGAANSWSNLNTVLPSGNATETYADTAVLASTQYFYRFSATISAGLSAATASVNSTTPAVTPANPGAFTISNIQANQVTLTWTESSPAITGYSIQASFDNSNWSAPIVVGNVLTTNITGLNSSTQYYFRISAVNGPVSSGFSSAGPINTLSAAVATTVIVDDNAAVLTGTWTSGNSTAGFLGTDYLSDGNTGKGTKTATYTPNLTAAGSYQVFARWTAATSRATNVPFDVLSASGTTTVVENEQLNNGKWISLGTFNFNGGTSGSVTIRTTGTNGYVIADAVEFVPAAPVTPTVPNAPTAFAATNIQPTSLTLNWTESSTVTAYSLQQSTDNATWSTPTVLGNVTTTPITGLTAGQTYYFRIAAVNSVGPSTFTTAGPIATPLAVGATTVVVDDTAATKVGAWTSGNSTAGFLGTDYLSDGNTGKGTKSVTYTPTLTAGGTYQVFARWTAATSRATNVPIDILHQGVTTTVTVNQQQNGGVWVLLGTFTFDPGSTSSVTIRTTGTNGYVIADGVEFVPA